jgi:ribosomal protein S18 acetylase RimI-like enzyme
LSFPAPLSALQAHAGERLVGAIISKKEPKGLRMRGYVAMLVVDPEYRKCGIGMRLAALAISRMRETCDEVCVGARHRCWAYSVGSTAQR